MKLYIDQAVQEGYDTEIFMDVRLTHYPLRDYCSMWGELQNTVKSYGKIGKRNAHALPHNKIRKHSMHLVRLYLMCLDLLEKGEIVTFREQEHDLLMDIRDGKYLDESGKQWRNFLRWYMILKSVWITQRNIPICRIHQITGKSMSL